MKSILAQLFLRATLASASPMYRVGQLQGESMTNAPRLGNMEGKPLGEQFLIRPPSFKSSASSGPFLPDNGEFVIGKRIVYTAYDTAIYWAQFGGQDVIAHAIGPSGRRSSLDSGSPANPPTSYRMHSTAGSPPAPDQRPVVVPLSPSDALTKVGRFLGTIYGERGVSWTLYTSQSGVHLWETEEFLSIFQKPMPSDTWEMKGDGKQACVEFLLKYYDLVALANAKLACDYGLKNMDMQPLQSTLWDETDHLPQLIDFSAMRRIRADESDDAFTRVYALSWGIAHRSMLLSKTCRVAWQDLEPRLKEFRPSKPGLPTLELSNDDDVRITAGLGYDMESVKRNEAPRRSSISGLIPVSMLFPTDTIERQPRTRTGSSPAVLEHNNKNFTPMKSFPEEDADE
ncbi:hypothetical protein FRB94_000761 [Tulasnella sp. JGI-2019a]|nr:hypothetical protein FRB94_000761 [Tulasnella sp. JGI-2019a]